MKTTSVLLTVTILISLFGATNLQAQNRRTAFLTAKEAGADFAIQGEYVGVIGQKTKLGAQVIALGKGKFRAVLYSKGLPGAGWDGKTKTILNGETKGGSTKFSGKNFIGSIVGERFFGTAEDNVGFEMNKTLRKSATLGAKPPKGAVVLFDGKNTDAWAKGKIEADGFLGVPARTKMKMKDFTLHMEFRTPFMPFARGQGRANSGMYLLDQYECQILDSFGLEGKDNECGGIYKIAKPKVNMCLPPLSWQTYDVEFRAARFAADGKKTEDAIVTIKLNGVVIHDKLKLPKITAGGGQRDEKPGALYMQDHGNPVRFRNIWVLEK